MRPRGDRLFWKFPSGYFRADGRNWGGIFGEDFEDKLKKNSFQCVGDEKSFEIVFRILDKCNSKSPRSPKIVS